MARREKKRRGYQKKRDRRERQDGKPVAIKANGTQVIEGQKRSNAMARALKKVSLRLPTIIAIR